MSTEDDKVIDLLAEAWKGWLSPEVDAFYRNHTYYDYLAVDHPGISQDFKDKMNGVRFISINTQSCYVFNFYLMKEWADPADELAWLEATLRKSEENGEKVILIGHIPIGTMNCLESWARRFGSLTERFQHVIRLNLFAHTHREEFLVTKAESGKPIMVTQVSASLTTLEYKNPSFRKIVLDKEFMIPVKIETYSLDITEANKHPETAPRFTLRHELSEEYNLTNLSPSNFLELAKSINTDEEVAKIFLE